MTGKYGARWNSTSVQLSGLSRLGQLVYNAVRLHGLYPLNPSSSHPNRTTLYCLLVIYFASHVCIQIKHTNIRILT